MDVHAAMSAWVAIALVAAYVSLGLELTVLHVPSVASTRGIWTSRAELVDGYSARFRRVFAWPRPLKLLALGLPLLIVYALYAYPLATLWLGRDLLADYLFTPRLATDLLGVALVVVGRTIALATVATLRRHDERPGDSVRLHVAGPFRWSRNPGLVGMYVFVAGLWLITPSATMLLGIVLYVLYMDFKVRMEEDFLANRFGNAYAEYRLRTGRYLR
jgi:protein-S-isoprenylcysteine O-methyltransferase Ste14